MSLTTINLPISPVKTLVAAPPALAATWECDLFDDSLRWTSGVFDLFGLERNCPLRRADVAAMYTPESRIILDRLRTHAIANCGSFTFDAEILRADGRLRWIRVTADVIVHNRRAIRLYGTKLDISDEQVP